MVGIYTSKMHHFFVYRAIYNLVLLKKAYDYNSVDTVMGIVTVFFLMSALFKGRFRRFLRKPEQQALCEPWVYATNIPIKTKYIYLKPLCWASHNVYFRWKLKDLLQSVYTLDPWLLRPALVVHSSIASPHSCFNINHFFALLNGFICLKIKIVF